MLHLLLGTDWTANRDEILRRISYDVRNEKENRILMVPELISHETERLLCAWAGDTASRFAEVLSFTRLARRVADIQGSSAENCLDAGGRVVAMASAVKRLSSVLKAYAAAETKPEFLTGLIDAVDEFKRCCISSQDLEAAAEATEGALAEKLHELALILESYDAVCAQGKRDPRDQETLLLEQMMENDFAGEHVFYIDGFPDFTRQHMAILELLIRKAPEVTISVNCDCAGSGLLAFEKAGDTAAQLIRMAREIGQEVDIVRVPAYDRPLAPMRSGLFQGQLVPGSCRELKVFRADSPYQETLCAAETIMELVQGGCRYRDITVICTDLGTYRPLVHLAFHRCGIPVYLTGTEDILQKSVISTVLSAMDAALGGFEQRAVLRYLRSVLSPVPPDVCDLVENYAIVWGIRGKRWQENWSYHPDGLRGVFDEASETRLQLINEAREMAITPLMSLADGFRSARNLSEQVQALYEFLQRIELEPRLDALAQKMDATGDNRSAQILDQLWEILIGAMEQLYDVLGSTKWETDAFLRLFQLLLSQYQVGTIPPVLDAVQCGQISAMRLHQQKHLIVLGAQEGNLPCYNGSSGVLTDQERVAIRNLGVPLTGGAMEGIQAEFAEIYGVFCGTTETVTVFSSGQQPSFVCRRLAELAGGEEPVHAKYGAALADPFEAAAFLAGCKNSETAAQLGLQDFFDAVHTCANFALGRVQRSHIDRLYGKRPQLSASQIDRQAVCRLSYFLEYGLRAKERKEATVDSAEFGTYVHAVLEKTARRVLELGGFPKVSLAQTQEIAKQYSDEYAAEHFSQLESERLSYLFRRNEQELSFVVQELWEELQQSGFQPAGFEVNFGRQAGLPAIDIRGKTMNAVLQGYVDRVDSWKQNGNDYYRVVDYKTGKKDFDYCDAFNGVGLQMLLYLFALQECGTAVVGKNPIPAGVQYFPARVPYLPTEGRLSPEEVDKLRMKEMKRKGLLLHDEQVLQAMEPGETPRRLCYTVKKDGSLSGDLADREQLKMLRDYMGRILGKMVDDIASGNVEPNPYTRGSSYSACTYCPYGAVCHEAEVDGRRNYKAMNAQHFWEEIGKEMDRDG
ncbi:MAG: PD-(D/E)XK nuclease family protein [Oscillospiraceae bacterium]|nr:PD-(D/E)XK nuclease family protein [Oscillospiraceae bacterium]